MNKEQILLFGAGRYAKKILDKVEGYFEIAAVIDNNKNSWRDRFGGKYPIISIDSYMSDYYPRRILVAVDRMEVYLEICNQLEMLNICFVHVNDALCKLSAERKQEFYVEEETTAFIEQIKDNACAFVLTAPAHSNLGDQAQAYCISEILEKAYPNYKIILLNEIELQKNFYELIYVIKRYIKESDLLFLHSGYRLTNLYMTSEYIVEMMARLFADRKILFLPQTVHYTDAVVAKKISSLINKNVSIMCRDEQSFINASALFPTARIELYPDVVTSLIGQYEYRIKRHGILMIMRDVADGESLFDKSYIQSIKKILGKIDKVDMTDTTIAEDWKKISGNRKYYIEREIKKYSGYRLVVTNRYHGAILSLAANTPVVILPTKDHKISSGIRWFEKAGIDSFAYCDNMGDFESTVNKLLIKADYGRNDTWFYDNYFKNMVIDD